jgi:hypothetical protein
MRKFLILLLGLSLLLSVAPNVRAQQNLATADLYTADVSPSQQFPRLMYSIRMAFSHRT